MKTLSIILGAVILLGCEGAFRLIGVVPVQEQLAVPTGLRSITGNGEITLRWDYDSPLGVITHFRVLRAEAPRGWTPEDTWVPNKKGYQLIVGTFYTEYVDKEVANGITYFYTLSAYSDTWKDTWTESRLSEAIHDTPRPVGYNAVLYNYPLHPQIAGFYFRKGEVVSYNEGDIMFFSDEDHQGEIRVSSGAKIQDYGYVQSLQDIDKAPQVGWSPDGVAKLTEGHAYIVFTSTQNYAAFRVTEIEELTEDGDWSIRISWCYQPARGNPEL